MSEWISVKERFPPKNEWVLCICQSDYNEKIYHVGRQKISGNCVEIGHNPQDYYGSRVMPITHWMKLPDKPNE